MEARGQRLFKRWIFWKRNWMAEWTDGEKKRLGIGCPVEGLDCVRRYGMDGLLMY